MIWATVSFQSYFCWLIMVIWVKFLRISLAQHLKLTIGHLVQKYIWFNSTFELTECVSHYGVLTEIVFTDVFFPSILWNVCYIQSCSVVSDSLRPHGLWPARLLRPWVSQARTQEWVAISFSRGSSPPQGLNPGLLHCRQMLLSSEPPGKSDNENKCHQKWVLLIKH